MFKYVLDSSSKKHTCPSCNKKSFVGYVDSETKMPVDINQYGRCDRENSCNYHQHPNIDPELATKAKPENYTPPPPTTYKQIYPAEQIWKPLVERTKTCTSPLHIYLSNKLLIPFDHLIKWGVVTDTQNDGALLTIYVYRNLGGQVCNLKWFKYNPDGHRDKNFNSFSLKQPKQNKQTPPPPPDQKILIEKYQLCIYGEHLLDPEKKKIVCVVESEKSAVIASFFYPQYDWVACGSANGLSDGSNGTADKLTPLKDREVWWLCDADKAGRMSVNEDVVKPSSVRKLLQHIDKVSVCDLFPDRFDGYDIGDAIIDGLRPEIRTTWTKGVDEITKADEKFIDKEVYEYDLPQGVDFETVKWEIRKYMHFEHEGRVYIVRKRKSADDKGATFFCDKITNFTIKSLGLIACKADPRRLIEMTNIHGLTKVLQVPTSAFASQTEFTVFLESEGNYQYDGVGTDLKKLRARLYDTMDAFEEVDALGWHRDGYFLFANGAYNGKFSPTDKYGFVKMNDKRFYIEALSALSRDNEEDFEDEKKFIYKHRDVKLKDWAKLFCDVHKDNGRMAIAWYIASLFRDFIYQRFKFFPHLFLFGPPGTGKSQVGWSVRAMGFVGLVKPFNLNTGTAVAFHREFGYFKNFPAWCDEYDNSIPYERIQALKAAYDGVGHKKSVKDSDKRTKSTQVNRAIMISGQQLPIADNALFKRVILLQFNQTDFSEHEKKIYSDLQDMEAGGLTHITAGFVHFRKLIEEKYMIEFEKVVSELANIATVMKFEPEDRILRNSAIILTIIKVLEDKLAEHLPYTYNELRTIIMENMMGQMGLISNTNETNTFWDTVMFLARDRKGSEAGKTVYAINESEDFAFEEKKMLKVCVNRFDIDKHLDKTTELLFIRFNKILPLYREAFKRQNSTTASPMDKASLMHYLSHSKPYIGMVSNYSFKDSRTSAYVFNYEILQAMGIYLGGSEGAQGMPPAPVKLRDTKLLLKQAGNGDLEVGTDDLPF